MRAETPIEVEKILAKVPGGIKTNRNAAALADFSADAYGRSRGTAVACVTPGNAAEVTQVIGWANRHRVPLVPVSSPGGTRRRGDTLPDKASVILDLSRLKRVIHADGRDRIAIVEPGVTFPEFDQYLRSHGLRAQKPLLPRRTKSVLTTFLEREPTTSPCDHWDSSDPLAALDFTFGGGAEFRTGGAGVTGTLEDNLKSGTRHMMTLGPIATDYTRVLCGAQGTLGVVKWGSIYCERIPARESAFLIGAQKVETLAGLAQDFLRRRYGGQLFILNNVQCAAAAGLSWQATDAQKLPPWLLYVNLTAPDYLPDKRMAYQANTLLELAGKHGAIDITATFAAVAQAIAHRQENLPDNYFKDAPLGGHREVFFLTQLDKVQRFLDPGLQAGQAMQVPVGIYIQPMVHGVSCHMEFTLFHRNDARVKAIEFADRLARDCSGLGGFFSRPYGNWAQMAYAKDPTITACLKTVKQMFDPNHILNAGKLCF